jgi:Major intrinsic protein
MERDKPATYPGRLWGSPVSGASMSPAPSLGPALVLHDWPAWWAYLDGAVLGGITAVGIACILRGPGEGGSVGTGSCCSTGSKSLLGGRPRFGVGYRQQFVDRVEYGEFPPPVADCSR